jgi:hypothetical protein
MLNFLIAVISQTYEQVMTLQIIYRYYHRADLNLECRRFLSNFMNLETYDCLLIQTAIEDELTTNTYGAEGESQWLGFVNTIKRYIAQQNYKQNEIFDQKLLQIDSKIDNIFQAIS